MEKRLRFRSLSPTAWRSLASGAAVALLSYWLAATGFGFGSFVVLTLALFVLAFPFSEWRTVQYSMVALALSLGALFSRTATSFPLIAEVLTAGALAALLFSAAAHRDPKRLASRIFSVALTFLAATLLFADPSFITFILFVFVAALTARDEARAWAALRVGEGKLIGAALGLLGAELAAFMGLLPLGPVRAGALTACALLLAREGLGEAYRGGLQRTLVFQGLAVFFVISVLLFASVPWVF